MNKFQPYIDRGWLSQLLPIIPPDGVISPDSNLNQKDAGKQPGFYNTVSTHWLGMQGWSINTTTEADIIAWCQWPGDAVGIRTRTTPGVDVDIDNIEIANMVNNMIHAFTGGTAFRWRNNSPRRMWFLQLAAGEVPQGKCRIILKDNLGAVELLWAGQQAVLSGTHPSGAMQVFQGTPVIVTSKQLNALWDAIINLLAPSTFKVTKAGEINLGERRGGEVVHVAEDEETIEIARQVIANTPGVGEGERDDSCYKLVTSVRQFQGITADKCFELMQEWGQRCTPPFPPNEIKTRINSGYGGGAQGAQGELNPTYMLKDANFGTHDLPATCSNHPIVSDIKPIKKEKPKKPMLPVPVSGINDFHVPLGYQEWDINHRAFSTDKPFGTLQNFRLMLSRYDIKVNYDMIKKDVLLQGECMNHLSDIKDNANHARIFDLCKLNQLDTGIIEPFMYSMMSENEVNPVKQWIESKPWDGIDRIADLFNTLTLDHSQDRDLAWTLFRKWLIGACKIGQGKINKFEFVLVLQDTIGGKGKTAWFNKLCPNPDWRKEGVLLDPSDKDSVKLAVSHWLVELGELDSIFKKADIKRLMAFLSNTKDEIRLPYAKSTNKYSRMTAFMGTVNKREFLMDDSGDRRFWPIAISNVNYQHDIDMQQLWAQVDTLDERYWLNTEENEQIINANKEFKALDPVEELLEMHFSKPVVSAEMQCLTVSTIMRNAGIDSPTKGQLNKAGAWLRDSGYMKAQIKGTRGYMVPSFALNVHG